MGGDVGPKVVIPSALNALKKYEQLSLILVGDQEVIRQELKANKAEESDRLVIHHCSQKVEMDELPSKALRYKKDSSMRVAINLVKQGQAQACVSAGNTGALMATARYVLKTLPGIDRPAIIAILPTIKKNACVRMLDLGANVDSKAEHLLQFAIMGSIVTEKIGGVASPRIGLLNIGEEQIKGNELVKKTAALFQENPFVNFTGYVEGTDIYQGDVDVIVCDGFDGNVALKSSEGAANLIAFYMKEAFNRNLLTRGVGLLAIPVLREISKRINPERYNGASMVGLNGIVVKSHGSANTEGFTNAIYEAMLQVKQNIPQQIRDKLAQQLTMSTQE